MIGQLPEYSLN